MGACGCRFKLGFDLNNPDSITKVPDLTTNLPDSNTYEPTTNTDPTVPDSNTYEPMNLLLTLTPLFLIPTPMNLLLTLTPLFLIPTPMCPISAPICLIPTLIRLICLILTVGRANLTLMYQIMTPLFQVSLRTLLLILRMVTVETNWQVSVTLVAICSRMIVRTQKQPASAEKRAKNAGWTSGTSSLGQINVMMSCQMCWPTTGAQISTLPSAVSFLSSWRCATSHVVNA